MSCRIYVHIYVYYICLYYHTNAAIWVDYAWFTCSLTLTSINVSMLRRLRKRFFRSEWETAAIVRVRRRGRGLQYLSVISGGIIIIELITRWHLWDTQMCINPHGEIHIYTGYIVYVCSKEHLGGASFHLINWIVSLQIARLYILANVCLLYTL